jgi:hypothetical protein
MTVPIIGVRQILLDAGIHEASGQRKKGFVLRDIPRVGVQVTYLTRDTDSSPLLARCVSTLRDAGWKVVAGGSRAVVYAGVPMASPITVILEREHVDVLRTYLTDRIDEMEIDEDDEDVAPVRTAILALLDALPRA